MRKRECKLLKKISKAIKQLNQREYLHRFGPKKYKLKHHLFALLIKESYQLSLRRAEIMLETFGILVPSYSALCKSRKKIPSVIWNKLIYLTSGLQHENAAIDMTGFSRTNPSQHYLARILAREYRKGYAKTSMIYDVERHKVITLHTKIKLRHELKDAKLLIRNLNVKVLLADKAYDAEWLHQYCFEHNIKTIIPKKKNIHRGFYRRKQMKNYSDEKYHQRSNIESGFSAIKRKYGGYVSGKSLKSINSELSCKAIAHNLRLLRQRFSTEPQISINLNNLFLNFNYGPKKFRKKSSRLCTEKCCYI